MMAVSKRPVFMLMMTLGVGLLAAVALVELLSAVAYSAILGGVIYWREGPPPTQPSHSSTETSLTSRTILHPVLGFSNRPGMTVEENIGSRRVQLLSKQGGSTGWAFVRANSAGFFSPSDYPLQGLDDHDFVVGVFGGSVAQWLAVQTGEYMASRIEDLDGFEGRRVRILPFAQGGFKYPQQIQALSYFSSVGQRFDVVIDISGFNELALSSFNTSHGVEAGWPSMMHLGPILGLIEAGAAAPETIGLLSRVVEGAERAAKLETLAAESRIASVWMLRFLQLRIVESRLSSDQASLAASTAAGSFDLFSAPPTDVGSSLEMSCRKAVSQWSRSASLMHALAKSIDAEFVEVIQPNQYHSRHRFSKNERSQALKAQSVYRKPVEVGYPFLQSAAIELRVDGIHVIDAVGVFDLESRPVFSDSCCHYNALGNRILADRIVEELRPVLMERVIRGRGDE